MSITAWRIVKARYAASAFSGEGARRFGGRWNSVGTPMVYTAQSQALAVLEMLVHIDASDLLRHYRLISVTFDEVMMQIVDPASLPRTWKRRPAPVSLRGIGDQWIASGRSVVLQVPSAIVPGERNFLINVLHPEFPKLAIGKPEPFRLNPRLK